MNISEHITYLESIKSQTAIRRGIDNTPDQDSLSRMRLLAVKIFEPVRERFKRPIYINSFYRSQQLNKAIGGANTSQHCKGEAMDIDCDSINDQIFYFIKDNLIYDQLIFEFGDGVNPAWVHASYTQEKPNRMQVLKASKINGKTRYQIMQ